MLIHASQLDREAAHNLLKGCVAPRPIAWVSTVSKAGVYNAAPYSCFTFVALEPPVLALSFELHGGKKKDTLTNIEATGQFVVNVVPEHLAEKMNASAANFPAEVSEFGAVGITPVAATKVKAPRIAESPIAMECQVVSIQEVGRSRHSLVLGEVLVFHVRDDVYRDGQIDLGAVRPLARLAGNHYGRMGEVFELPRPWLTKG